MPLDQGLARLWQAVEASCAILQRRREQVPRVQYPPELPVSERREEVAALIARHQVVVLCGETGSGKSTQLPKICLEQGRGIFGRIGHTQPRRIAARTLASRVAQELGGETGGLVGYKVRFHDRVRPETCIKLMTDGILLAEIQQDRYLNEYDTLIIDEAHERGLNIDFLLGYLRGLLPKRPDLKVIVTSATIDPQRFARHFADAAGLPAPIIEISGRTHPVEVRYQPPEEENAGERDEEMQLAISAAVDELARAGRGDVLVFLSGESEIRETAETLRKHHPPSTEILPLYARQSPAEQARVFQAHGTRRVVLATNVAETSLTVPGIHYVIDPGFARLSRYSHRTKVQRLPVERVSQASANQRQGRCGRVAAGICIRLYSEDNFQSRAAFTEPEIQRANLAAVILQMKLLGFGDIAAFPFIDPPDPRLVADGYRTLEELAALDAQGALTHQGRQLARLPLDPRIGRMLLAAAELGCLPEMLVIAAALSVQDPRERPLEQRQAADEIHATFNHPDSDFLTFLNLWYFLEKERAHLTRNKFRQLCQRHFLSWNRVTEWRDVHTQLHAQMAEMGFKVQEQPADVVMADAERAKVHPAIRPGPPGRGPDAMPEADSERAVRPWGKTRSADRAIDQKASATQASGLRLSVSQLPRPFVKCHRTSGPASRRSGDGLELLAFQERSAFTTDLDLARLHGLGDLAAQFDVEESVLQAGVHHADIIRELELALEAPIGDAAIEKAAFLVVLTAGTRDGQDVLLDLQPQFARREAGNGHGDAVVVLAADLHVVGRITARLGAIGVLQGGRQPIEAYHGAEERGEVDVCHGHILNEQYVSGCVSSLDHAVARTSEERPHNRK